MKHGLHIQIHLKFLEMSKSYVSQIGTAYRVSFQMQGALNFFFPYR